jgi:hypothetical protein
LENVVAQRVAVRCIGWLDRGSLEVTKDFLEGRNLQRRSTLMKLLLGQWTYNTTLPLTEVRTNGALDVEVIGHRLIIVSEAVRRWMLLHDDVSIVGADCEYGWADEAQADSVSSVEREIHLSRGVHLHRDISLTAPVNIRPHALAPWKHECDDSDEQKGWLV